MVFMDTTEKEDRVDLKISTLYELMKEAAKAELIQNAVNCDVPYEYIREMLTGEKEINVGGIVGGFTVHPTNADREERTLAPEHDNEGRGACSTGDRSSESPGAKDKKEKKKPVRRPRIDTGKLFALHDAKWSEKDIADELGCSIQTVQRHVIERSKEIGARGGE